MDTKINRKFGVRIGLVIGAVIVYFITLVILGQYPELDQVQALETLKWLIGTFIVAVLGDTWRPSGQKMAAHRLETVKLPDGSEG